MKRVTPLAAGMVLLVALQVMSATVEASHQWGCYRWDHTNLRLRSLTPPGPYAEAWEHARSVWNAVPTPLSLNYAGRPADTFLFAGDFGDNGWLDGRSARLQ